MYSTLFVEIFASREPNDFLASSCFMAPENAKIFQMLLAGIRL
jgi:hypothetical protein